MLSNLLKIASCYCIVVDVILTIHITFATEANEDIRRLLVSTTVNFILFQSFLPKEERWIFK